MLHDSDPQLTLPWLVRLRWLAVLGQVVAVAVAHWGFRLGFPFGLLSSLTLLAALSNLGLMFACTRLRGAGAAAQLTGCVMAFDTLLLTALLAASGGAMNPFTVLYLVHITLSAMVLSAGWTLLVAALSFAGFGSLFLVPMQSHALHHGMGPHLQGMWVAFVLAAALTTFFVRRISQAIRIQREEIASLREAGARNARLAAITQLAAGAAHELGSPLGTIAVAAHDARLALRSLPGAAAHAEDLELILLEVERCQEILSRMAARAAPAGDEPRLLEPVELMRSVRAQLGEEQAARIDFELATAREALPLPPGQTIQSVVALVRNALDASSPGARVRVLLREQGREAQIAVEDGGAGMPLAVLQRLGEPFFTTKQPGRGMGLGVFLVRAFVESQGGELRIESRPGVGTSARMRIPFGPVGTPRAPGHPELAASPA
jgi:two-component system sensor histidine kinase RegB